LSDDAALLDALSEAIDPTDVKALRAAPLPLARRALRRWLRRESDGEHHPPDAATIERALAVARGDASATDLGGGRRLTRSRGRLTITS
jgi:tRNA(Ile)-lysidine synthase